VSTDLAYSVLGPLGRPRRADDSLTIAGDDPVFVTPWRIAQTPPYFAKPAEPLGTSPVRWA